MGYRDEILRHMAAHFGPLQELALHEILPVTGIAVHFIPAGPGRDGQVAFTTGMSDHAQAVPPGQEEYRHTELMIHLPADWPTTREALADPARFWPIRWLKEVAAYPRAADTWLGGAFPIISSDDPPAPLGPGTDLSCLLLLRVLGEEGTVRCDDGTAVALYHVLPIYTEERDLEIRAGIGELLGRLQAHQVPFEVDPARVNVATA